MVQSNLFAQQAWKEISKIEYNASKKEVYHKKNMPKDYQLVSLDIDLLQNNFLSKSKKTKQIIQLPDETGNFQQFEIKEISNFEEGLQQKFPNIKSYTAKGIDDETAVAKISVGVDGFHATVYSAKKPTVYIDPFSKDKKDYIVYNRKSLSKVEKDFTCLVEESAKEVVSSPTFNKSINDGRLRTFRIAIVCSGEYAQFHLNRQNIASNASDAVKKAAVLSAMNTSMTRINGVFEKDLGVRMVIVNNNDNVIFLDPATDNITDGNANTMINEVQAICDAQIGTSNYDIGHIFSVGGDGLAGLGVVCESGQKARGVTGIASPVNDPYDIDYVAHELGHQFGANHTQNNDDCNRNLQTAVEPGSGTTIMGYAGICAPNVFGVGNSTGNSDDYFHTISISEMQAIINSTGNCASLSITNNATPTANAGVDYSIPRSTPFKLTGSATDADGLNSLTYNWEQIDNEVGSMPPSSTNSVGPMFRSLPSKITPIRYFPDLATIVGGNLSSQWEVIPSVARDLNFAFTVRDNHVGGGSTARDDMRVSVINTDPFTVTSQQSAITWNTGSSQTITWNVGNTFNSPINCKAVNIRLSTDGGLSFPILLRENTPNDGTETLIIPNNATTNARIMVEAADNIFYNINPVNFTINSTTPTFVMNNISGAQAVCNSNNQTASYTLNFDFVNNFSETVSLSATGLPNGAQVSFVPNTINTDGNVVMTISNLNGATAQDYLVNVLASSNSINQNINVDLKVTSSNFTTLILTSPTNGSSNVAVAPNFVWQSNENASSYDIQIATDSNFNNIVESGTVSLNNFTTNNLNPNTQYFWRVKPKNTCSEGVFSSIFSFTTQAPPYCESTFTDEAGGTEHITRVVFNTIDNSSGNDTVDGYQNFTSISTNVKRGETHSISVTFNTGGYRDQCFVYIDWNRDFIFDNNSEKYDLGQAIDADGNVNTTNLSTLTGNISVPANAFLGATRMRVFIEYFDGNTFVPGSGACDSNHASEWGETEDYTLIIEDETASIEDEAFNNFNLFPNPTTGEFTVKFNVENSSEVTLQLYDVRGRMVEEKKYSNVRDYFSEKVILNRVSSGLYLLKIINGNKQTTKKLMIK